jgi:ERCC4-related helicase
LCRYQWRGINAAIVTASTPVKQRMKLLARHENGEIEAMVSVGVLAEGWDNPHCNIIVHLRPTLSKVLWGQSVGRGLRAAPGKDKCIVIDVSSNWSTFGPVEKLEWSLWSHRRSYMQFMNRFNWIGQQQNWRTGRGVRIYTKKTLMKTIPVLFAEPMLPPISTRNRSSMIL